MSLNQMDKFAILLRWDASKGKGSIARIADELKLPREDVKRHIMELERRGYKLNYNAPEVPSGDA